MASLADHVRYRDAREADAEALAALFAETFTETFGHLYGPRDLADFLSEQTPAHWAEQLRDPAFAVRIAEDEGGAVGLAKLGPLKLPVGEDTGDALELRQLYVLDRVRGSGVARTLMDWLLGEARGRGARQLFLSVYTENPRAQRFYARYGFTEVGPYVFKVGDHEDADMIMKLALG